MELIEVNSYTEMKISHCKRLSDSETVGEEWPFEEQLNITGSALEKMIHSYTREAGVRIWSAGLAISAARQPERCWRRRTVDPRDRAESDHYLGREKVFFDAAGNEAQVGIVRGLAWTSVGGDTLQIEVNVMPGKRRTDDGSDGRCYEGVGADCTDLCAFGCI